jgi:hypothetical protein
MTDSPQTSTKPSRSRVARSSSLHNDPANSSPEMRGRSELRAWAVVRSANILETGP